MKLLDVLFRKKKKHVKSEVKNQKKTYSQTEEVPANTYLTSEGEEIDVNRLQKLLDSTNSRAMKVQSKEEEIDVNRIKIVLDPTHSMTKKSKPQTYRKTVNDSQRYANKHNDVPYIDTSFHFNTVDDSCRGGGGTSGGGGASRSYNDDSSSRHHNNDSHSHGDGGGYSPSDSGNNSSSSFD